MEQQISDLKVKVPKEKKAREKKEKEPTAPKIRKKKIKGVFKVEQGTFMVRFD